jgi:hypothetical protein
MINGLVSCGSRAHASPAGDALIMLAYFVFPVINKALII